MEEIFIDTNKSEEKEEGAQPRQAAGVAPWLPQGREVRQRVLGEGREKAKLVDREGTNATWGFAV